MFADLHIYKLNKSLLDEYVSNGQLHCNKHPYLDLYTYKYRHEVFIDGDWDWITSIARGLVIDGNGFIIGRPFRKFFNIEEQRHTPTKEFDVFEKVDGSLIILFNYNGTWIASTTGSFQSEHSKIALDMLNENCDLNSLDSNFTYLFEFTSPNYPIVIKYETDGLTLLGAIETRTGLEMEYSQLVNVANQLGFVNIVKYYNGIEDYTKLKQIIDDNSEGFVIRFKNGDRVKIKGEHYVRLHGIVTGTSTTSVWRALKSGVDIKDMLIGVPDEFYDKVVNYASVLKNSHDFILNLYSNEYKKLKEESNGNRTKFALKAKTYEHSTILFNMLTGRDSSEYIYKFLKPEYRPL